MRLFSKKFYHETGENKIAQPVVFCPRCLVLLIPSKQEKDGRPILCYEHWHKPLWIYLIQMRDGRRKYRYPTKRKTPLRNILDFAAMGWILDGWSVLQVAHYINLCLMARKEGLEIDALTVLIEDYFGPSEDDKAMILRALGLKEAMT
jgi:hypothetical protein